MQVRQADIKMSENPGFNEEGPDIHDSQEPQQSSPDEGAQQTELEEIDLEGNADGEVQNPEQDSESEVGSLSVSRRRDVDVTIPPRKLSVRFQSAIANIRHIQRQVFSHHDDEDDEEQLIRGKWGRKFDFFLACVGISVGLGNVWRFPYLCYKNGGGAFLIPYLIAVVVACVPLFFLEVIQGQMVLRGGIEAWNIIPICKGVGIAQIVIVFYLTCYYNVILSWCFYYFFSSLKMVLPWSHCNNTWNTPRCTVLKMNIDGIAENTTTEPLTDANDSSNGSVALTYIDSSVEFWEYKVTNISSGIEELGEVKWDICLCLLFAWFIVFVCVIKGIKSSGKALYVTATVPYLLLLILLIKSATLDGAFNGVKYYMLPNISRLADKTVWVDAGTQAFFSLSLGLGALPALGSYNRYDHNCLRDSMLCIIVDSLTSFIAGFVIFMTLGYMSHITNLPIAEVAESGPGLAFIAYPKALATLPGAPVWSTIFFMMLIFLGLDSEFVCVEGVITAVTDMFPRIMLKGSRRGWFTFGTCVVCFLIGLSMVCRGGVYVLQLFDYYSGQRMILLICCLHCLSIVYIYGGNKFCTHIVEMVWFPKPVEWFFKVMWGILTPIYLLIMFGISAYVYREFKYKKASSDSDYHFPPSAIIIGWIMAASSVAFIPGVFIYKMVRTRGTFMERIKFLCTPQYPEDSPLSIDYDTEPYDGRYPMEVITGDWDFDAGDDSDLSENFREGVENNGYEHRGENSNGE